MLLRELSDQQIAGAFINQDPVKRRQDNALTPQQLAKNQAVQIGQDRQSKDTLTQRITALRAQLAQLILQKQNQEKQQAAQNPVANPAAPTGPQAR